MDRTIIAPFKAEERELGEKLYQKLQGLALLYPTTEEFRKQITSDAFLKPNQTAFIQIMHYLFRLLDPAEFKRRFYWPITDKRSEGIFRTSTVDYLKHLNEKHQLQWNIKSYLVVMPGGMKFINFLLDLIAFVVKELVRKRKKDLNMDVSISELKLNLSRMRKKNALFKQYSAKYIASAKELTLTYQDKSKNLREKFAEISMTINIPIERLLDDKFHAAFEEDNRKQMAKKYTQPTEQMLELENSLSSLKESMETFLSRDPDTKYDNEELREAVRKINESYPMPTNDYDNGNYFAIPNSGDGTTMNTLITTYNRIHNAIQMMLADCNEQQPYSEFMMTETGRLKCELMSIETQITDFNIALNARIKKQAADEKNKLEFRTPARSSGGQNTGREPNEALISKFVSTPPIRFDALNIDRGIKMRLPLMDDFNSKSLDTLNFPAFPRTARKPKSVLASPRDIDTTLNSSKIIGPMQLLRTINKDANKDKSLQMQSNLSFLGGKWKERQNLFNIDYDAATPLKSIMPEKKMAQRREGSLDPTATATTTQTPTITTSPFSPFNTNERTRIARSKFNMSNGSGAASTTLMTMQQPSRKLSAVKKVQDASINIHNLSTSPSGRLDPLVAMAAAPDPEPEPRAVPAIHLNDYLFNDDENNPNFGNFDYKLSFEDDLGNISDSVLQDVIM